MIISPFYGQKYVDYFLATLYFAPLGRDINLSSPAHRKRRRRRRIYLFAP